MDNKINITDLVNMHDVLERYCSIPRSNRKNTSIPCPIHNGKNRNFGYTDRVFQCFKCGAKGNALTFVSQYFGISNKEAFLKINDDFGLGLLDNNKPGEDLTDKLKAAAAQREALNQEKAAADKLNKEYKQVTDEIYHIQEMLKQTTDLDNISVLCTEKSRLEYKAELLLDEILERG